MAAFLHAKKYVLRGCDDENAPACGAPRGEPVVPAAHVTCPVCRAPSVPGILERIASACRALAVEVRT